LRETNKAGAFVSGRSRQIVSEDIEDIGVQGHEALLVSFAVEAHLAVGELHILDFHGQDLAGAQADQEHESDQGQISVST